jgi:hypothetical protein
MSIYLAPELIDLIDEPVEASIRVLGNELNLQTSAHITPQKIQNLECFKRNVGKNSSDLDKRVYKG